MMKGDTRVRWWRTKFGKAEASAAANAIMKGNISQGEITARFEERIGKILEIDNVVATANGSAALMMALMALEVGIGDEVIVPNRSWIATAHAIHILGAIPVFADVEAKSPVISVRGLGKLISDRTKAIIPVHLNGRSADMAGIRRFADRYGLAVIEDAAQAFFSRNSQGFLGTQSEVGCFSLSVAKIISSGQGGLLITKSRKTADRLREVRTHGVENVKDPETWGEAPGLNFRLTDIQAAVGLVQLGKLSKKVAKLIRIYELYSDHLDRVPGLSVIPVSVETGEVPIYMEILCEDRAQLIASLGEMGIETRPFVPNLARAPYFNAEDHRYENSQVFHEHGLTLPSGPGQLFSDIMRVTSAIQAIRR